MVGLGDGVCVGTGEGLVAVGLDMTTITWVKVGTGVGVCDLVGKGVMVSIRVHVGEALGSGVGLG